MFYAAASLHHAAMRMPWNKPREIQLDLLDQAAVDEPAQTASHGGGLGSVSIGAASPSAPMIARQTRTAGRPMQVPIGDVCEDPQNPRTEFPEAELEELAEDIRQHGILQPIVVHPGDASGRYRIHFGAKRLRAAVRAGLAEVPVVIRVEAADPYTQVAENQKRHGLSPLDLARFIQRRVDAGDSNATIGRRLGMNLTTVAHHLSLLALPPVLDAALQSGRCTSPRTLHELSRLHEAEPDRVAELIASAGEITRAAVTAMRDGPVEPIPGTPAISPSVRQIAKANAACDRLEKALARLPRLPAGDPLAGDLAALRQRLAALPARWSAGV